MGDALDKLRDERRRDVEDLIRRNVRQLHYKVVDQYGHPISSVSTAEEQVILDELAPFVSEATSLLPAGRIPSNEATLLELLRAVIRRRKEQEEQKPVQKSGSSHDSATSFEITEGKLSLTLGRVGKTPLVADVPIFHLAALLATMLMSHIAKRPHTDKPDNAESDKKRPSNRGLFDDEEDEEEDEPQLVMDDGTKLGISWLTGFLIWAAVDDQSVSWLLSHVEPTRAVPFLKHERSFSKVFLASGYVRELDDVPTFKDYFSHSRNDVLPCSLSPRRITTSAGWSVVIETRTNSNVETFLRGCERWAKIRRKKFPTMLLSFNKDLNVIFRRMGEALEGGTFPTLGISQLVLSLDDPKPNVHQGDWI